MARLLGGAFLLLAGCVSYAPVIRESINANHEALTLVEKREYAAGTRLAEDTLRKLADVSSLSVQMQFEGYVERGIAWYVIGFAKFDAGVPRDEKGNRKYDDVFRIMGTPEGGAVEFEKAIAEFSQAYELKAPYVAYHLDAVFFALSRQHLGDFESALKWFGIGLEEVDRRRLPDSTREMYLRHRALCNHMYAYHIHTRGSGDREAVREAYRRAKEDLAAIQTLKVTEAERTWAKEFEADVTKLIKP